MSVRLATANIHFEFCDLAAIAMAWQELKVPVAQSVEDVIFLGAACYIPLAECMLPDFLFKTRDKNQND